MWERVYKDFNDFDADNVEQDVVIILDICQYDDQTGKRTYQKEIGHWCNWCDSVLNQPEKIELIRGVFQFSEQSQEISIKNISSFVFLNNFAKQWFIDLAFLEKLMFYLRCLIDEDDKLADDSVYFFETKILQLLVDFTCMYETTVELAKKKENSIRNGQILLKASHLKMLLN